MVELKRFDVCSVTLDPTIGSELQKTRPCIIISPNSMNRSRLKTVIIAPMTTTIRDQFPTRVKLEFHKKQGQVALDQLRVIDRTRITKKIGTLESEQVRNEILRILRELFS